MGIFTHVWVCVVMHYRVPKEGFFLEKKEERQKGEKDINGV